MSTSDKKWYVLRAISGKEKKIKEYIQTEIIRNKLEDYIDQVVIPIEKVFSIRNGKKISQERNFYPGYIFVYANLIGEVPHILKNIPGVIGYPGVKGEPVYLTDEEIQTILGKADELSDSNEKMNNPYIVGEFVKIIEGAFVNFSGEVEEVMESTRKLKVAVKILGRKQQIELSFTQVEREEETA